MTDEERPLPIRGGDDTEGHSFRLGADADTPEGHDSRCVGAYLEDAEGGRFKAGVADPDDDTEGQGLGHP